MNSHLRKPGYLVMALVLLLQGCGRTAAPLGESEPVKLKMVTAPYLAYGPLFIAQEEGFFAEQGLEVEIVKMPGTDEAIPGLAQGQLDVGGVNLSAALLKAIGETTNLKIVAGRNYIATDSCTYSGFVARRALVESGELENPAQLRGRRIAIDVKASVEGYRLEKLLDMGQLTLDDIEAVNVALPAQLEAYEKGTVDVTGTGEPWITRLVNTGYAVMWVPAEDVIPDFQMGILVYGPTLVENNPDAGRRFMVAYLKGVEQYNQGKTERNLEIVAEYTELDRELLMQACWPSFSDDGGINFQSVLDFQAWAVEKGYLDNAVTEEQFWDSSFVDYANQALEASSQ